MKIVKDINILPEKDLVLTMGFFDGMHRGHRFLIDHLCETAAAEELGSSLLTFWPHPRTVLNVAYQPKLLNTIEEKNELLQQLPIDYCYQIPFTLELSQYSAFDFMKSVLKEKLRVKHLIIGYDHRFGHNRSEGFDDYCEYGRQLDIEVTHAPNFSPDGEHVSSTAIRKLIDLGEVEKAKNLLGYTYSIHGKVEHGKHIGTTIGFPTANVCPSSINKIIPAEGVYAVRVVVDEKKYDGMACIGNRPTFEENGRETIEVNLFDYNGDLYGKEVEVEFVSFMRNQYKFSSKESLREALEDDKRKAQDILNA
jgi:riboflavin kinase / FMN adenylyltransferase